MTHMMHNMIAKNGQADLHIHSVCSDGSMTPEAIVKYASNLGLSAISITDHDNINAIDTARQLAGHYGIEFISGVEISARYGKNELHILGYFFDHREKELTAYLRFLQEERIKRAEKIVRLLTEYGMPMNMNEVKAKAKNGSIGRPHIAEVMVDLGLVKTYQEAFDSYLGEGCPCYFPKFKISPSDAVRLIGHAGGLSFIAHPGVDLSLEDLLKLIKLGIEGIETIHPRHTSTQISHYRRIIREYRLLESGGSDCHGERKQSSPIGKYTIPYELVIEMKERLSTDMKPE